jgi:hypothetical protein
MEKLTPIGVFGKEPLSLVRKKSLTSENKKLMFLKLLETQNESFAVWASCKKIIVFIFYFLFFI